MTELAITPRPAVTKRLGLTPKLVALMVLTTSAVVLFLGIYFPEQQIRASREALEKKAATYGRLVSHQVASAIAFDDIATAREVFESVSKDEDVESLTLLKSSGEVLHEHGKAGSWIAAAKRGVVEQRVLDLDEHIAVVAPVVSLEGPRGTLVIELSTENLARAKARITRTAMVAGLIALAFGSLFALLIARSLGRRVGAIAEVASKVANGDLDQRPAAVGGSDEIAVLGGAFNAMLAQIQGLVGQIKKSAHEEQTRLEGLVNARTRELDGRNEDMRRVLDNVGQGFVAVDLNGAMSEERSAILREWFGAAPDSNSLFDYVDQRFPGKGGAFRLAFETLREDWMPVEVGLDQLPATLESKGRHFGFSYRPIRCGEQLEKLVIVVSDTTALVESQRAEEEERELVQVMRWMISDRSGFMNFLSEADELVHEIFSADCGRPQRLRQVHTLKGNAAIFGFQSIARLCHGLEDRMVEESADLTIEERQKVRSAWSRLRDKMRPFLEGRRNDVLDVPRKEYQRIVHEVSARSRHSSIGSLLSSWELEPTEDRFRRLGDNARSLAERLGKKVELRVESNDVRLDPSEWTRFWQAVVHVVRNAVDHGLESPESRCAAGKPESGTLVLRSIVSQQQLFIEVEDDGRGIDWDRVAEVAKSKGLPTGTARELEAALFSDELSTRGEATQTSGRGVGLSAVRQVCEETGGHIRVSTSLGQRTTFTFEWNIDEKGRRAATYGKSANGLAVV